MRGETSIISLAASAPAAASMALLAPDDGMFSSWRLVAYCIIGSVAGALLAITIWTPDGTSERNLLRRLAAKFVASMVGGVTLAPALLEHYQPLLAPAGLRPATVLAASCVIAMMSVAILHRLAPWAERRLDDMLGGLKKPNRRG